MRRSILLAALAVSAAAQPEGVTKVATVEGITEYRLGNGLRAVLFPDATKATITVNIAYFAGSRHESYGETGMAHILEHLMSYGSIRHPDAKAEQSARGASRNATTSFDRTTYYETFPATSENLAWAIDLESDRMRNAAVRKEILDSQMSVVRNEWEAGENSPENVLFQRVLATAYLWHNYGKTAIGARSDIENVPIEKLKAFYDRYYHPNNAVLVVAGKFDEKEALALIARKFGPIPASPQAIPRTYTVEPAQDGERSVTLRRVGDVQALALGYHIPAASHPDMAALRVLMNVVAASPNGRLYQALVPTKKAARVGASTLSLNQPGLAFVQASVRKQGSLDEVREIATRVLDNIAKEPITGEEAERARTQLLSQFDRGLNDSTMVGMMLAEAAASGDWRLLYLGRDQVRKVTAADLTRVASTYLVPSNRTVGMFIPEEKPLRAEIPAAPAIDTLVKDYTGDKVTSLGEAFDPSPANIEKRAQRGALTSGLKYALLPKKTRGESVHVVLALHYGSLEALRGRALESEVTASMLMRGTTARTRQQIDDVLNRLKARLTISATSNTLTARLETVRSSLPAALKLAGEVLRSPSFPAAEFDQLRQAMLASAESARREPQAMAQTALQRHIFPYAVGDPRGSLSPEDRIAALPKLTVEQLRTFHRDFYGASAGELTAVGDFDADELRSLAQELFGGWKSAAAYADLRREGGPRPVTHQLLDAPDKTNAVFFAAQTVPLKDSDPDFPALVLANYMLGGHSTSRLYLRIRGKEGLSYGVGSMLGAYPGDAFSLFQAYAIAAPGNVPKVEAAFREEVERAAKEGFRADEVAKAKSGWLQSRGVNRSQDSTLAGQLQSLARYGRTTAWDAAQEKKVEAVTPEQAAWAVRKYLSVSAISVVASGDFKKAGVTQ